jgi:GGDEF domain-containing protein
MMELAAVSRPGRDRMYALNAVELSRQLRDAVMDGDEARIARLLSELLRVKGLTRGQRVRLQLRALSNLVHSLRAVALNDETTGLPNRRGFMQTATRLLDLAARDQHSAHLVYLCIGEPGAQGAGATSVQIRQLGNLMRDLFPSYGVYEVLGRLSGGEFVAVTLSAEQASRSAILLRAQQVIADLPVSVGVAHFSSDHPVAIDELLQDAVHAVSAQPLGRVASSGFAPQPGMTLC